MLSLIDSLMCSICMDGHYNGYHCKDCREMLAKKNGAEAPHPQNMSGIMGDVIRQSQFTKQAHKSDKI